MPDGAIMADCRLLNRPWDDGTQVLTQVASTWQQFPGCMVSRRQFVLLEPAPLSEVDPTGS